MSGSATGKHAADAAALGFYYQAFYGLLLLVEQDSDDAAIVVEQLDDVVLMTQGHDLLYQLKHSLADAPPPLTIQSASLWRTVKVWVDALPRVTLSEATFHLVSVAGLAMASPLRALVHPKSDLGALQAAMEAEAERVQAARSLAADSQSPLPFGDKAAGCEAFLGLNAIDRSNLLRRAQLTPDAPAIDEIEARIAERLLIVPSEHRSGVAKRLVQWWDREVVYSLCGKRDRVIRRAELQSVLSNAIGAIEQGVLIADFETTSIPVDYQPDGMLARQIRLVRGAEMDLSRAIREEWRARQQRSKWMNENPAMRSVIGNYDLILREHWSDKHGMIREECLEQHEDVKCTRGLSLLRWTHEAAPSEIRPIASGWGAPYYIRGSLQVLAVNREVGWHPDYLSLLEGDD